MRTRVNVRNLAPDFNKLTLDPYVKQGFRRKHIMRVKYTSQGFVKQPSRPLYQSKQHNPIHGDIQRTYPDYKPHDLATLSRVIEDFITYTHTSYESELLIQAQRITCSSELIGLPSVENWHKDGVKHIGILVVARENIIGGLNEFRPCEQPFNITTKEISPGYMAVFEDAYIHHRVTPIEPREFNTEGYRDVLLISS